MSARIALVESSDFPHSKLRPRMCQLSSLKEKMYSVSSYPVEMDPWEALSSEVMTLIHMPKQARLSKTLLGLISLKKMAGQYQWALSKSKDKKKTCLSDPPNFSWTVALATAWFLKKTSQPSRSPLSHKGLSAKTLIMETTLNCTNAIVPMNSWLLLSHLSLRLAWRA